jgi:hypothetical protein
MATFTKTNGSTQPVFAIDVQNGSIAQTANIAAQGPVQMAGPKLEFFSIVANSALSVAGAANVNGLINNVLTAVQQTVTVAMYQVSPADATVLNLAVYPAGAANTTTLLAAAQGANSTGGLTTIGFTSCAGNAVFTSSPLS